mmetsp:Transcript_34721/g.95723  ORF Transcript_34721/g.95723 Transcript_34721/m.95723 type:complete len:200 (-) Transcript_34721:1071-1670(-)
MARNVARLASRSHCSLSPWMLRHQPPRPRTALSLWMSASMLSQLDFRAVKTIAVSPGLSSSLIVSLSCRGLSSSRRTSTDCRTSLLALNWSLPTPCPMRTCTALARVSEAAMCCTALGHVAVKSKVCRSLQPGHFPTISRIEGSNPMSNMRSASSNTKYPTASRETVGQMSRDMSPASRSRSRPGQAMRTSAPSFNSRT